MPRSALIAAIALFVLGCDSPSAGSKRPKEKPKGEADAAETAPSSAEPGGVTANGPAATPDTPSSAEAPGDLKLKVDAEPPKVAIAPEKSDPECQAKDATGKAPLGEADQGSVFKAYLAIQQDYLSREKGAKEVKLVADPKDPLSFKLAFKDLLGNSGAMSYKFGKVIVAADDTVTLCLDEGQRLLWAGSYKRGSDGKFALVM
jgi:hypothetical protein